MKYEILAPERLTDVGCSPPSCAHTCPAVAPTCSHRSYIRGARAAGNDRYSNLEPSSSNQLLVVSLVR